MWAISVLKPRLFSMQIWPVGLAPQRQVSTDSMGDSSFLVFILAFKPTVGHDLDLAP